MKKYLLLLVLSVMGIYHATSSYAKNTESSAPGCYITGNVECSVEEYIALSNQGYTGLRINMNNKNDYMVNIYINLTVDGETASRQCHFVLDPEESRRVNLFFYETVPFNRENSLDYVFRVERCY